MKGLKLSEIYSNELQKTTLATEFAIGRSEQKHSSIPGNHFKANLLNHFLNLSDHSFSFLFQKNESDESETTLKNSLELLKKQPLTKSNTKKKRQSEQIGVFINLL